MSRRWYRLSWNKAFLFGALFGALALVQPPIVLHAKEPANKLPALLNEVETLYRKSATLSAGFNQTTEDAALGRKKISSGKIYVKRPSKFRWETLKPDPSLFVSDGHHFWYYTPPFDEGERGQLVEKKASTTQSKLASTLLSGSFSMMKDMKVKALDNSQFQLLPKKGTAGTVQKATIQVNPTSKRIEKVILEHQGGNRTEINLNQIQLGVSLSHDLFSLSPPPNTDLVTEADTG